MKKILALSLLFPLALSACGGSEVRAASGILRATAQHGAGSFTFACDPAAQTSSPISIGNTFALSCPSSDQKAVLTVQVSQKAAGNAPGYAATATLTLAGAPTPAATATGDLADYSRSGQSSFSGKLDLSGATGLSVRGEFSLSSKQ